LRHVLGEHYKLQETQADNTFLQYCWRVVCAKRGIRGNNEKKKNQPKRFPVPADLAPLFNTIILVLNRSILLAAEGVMIEKYYYSPSYAVEASTVGNKSVKKKKEKNKVINIEIDI